MPHYIKTGYWDLKAKAPKEWLNLEKLIADNTDIVSVTKSQVDNLISTNGLAPGTTYAISGVDVNLYGGTTILLQAEATNKLSISGHGVFYNPKYDQSMPFNGYGIWSNFMNVRISNITGDFFNGDTVTTDNGATGIYYTSALIQYVSGDWTAATSMTDDNNGNTADVILNDYKINSFNVTSGIFQIGESCITDTGESMRGYYGNGNILVWSDPNSIPNVIASTSITGDESGATADVSISLRQPSYNIGNSVIWGGKKWVNVNGNLGTALDRYTLDSEWIKIDYNSDDYDVVIDDIMYDYERDMIIARRDKWDNEVRGNYQIFKQLDYYTYNDGLANPIKDFQWGNGSYWYQWNPVTNQPDPNLYDYTGVVGNKIEDSYVDCLNFTGPMFWYNNFSQRSQWWNNIFNADRSGDYYRFNTITQDSSVNSNIFSFRCDFYENIIINGYVSYNKLNDLSISNNLIKGGEIHDNVGKGEITNNTIINSYIEYNKSGINSVCSIVIFGNHLEANATISSNMFSNITDYLGKIERNHLINYSAIANNTIGDNCYISENSLDNCSPGISQNIVTGDQSSIESNTLKDYGSISRNYLYGAYGSISNNILQNYGSINDNLFEFNGSSNNFIIFNRLFGGYLGNCYLYGGYISNNKIENSSILYFSLDGSGFEQNYMNNSVANVSISGGKYISGIETSPGSNISIDDSATVVFGNYSKKIFKNSAGVTKLGYYNASNVFTIVDVNA